MLVEQPSFNEIYQLEIQLGRCIRDSAPTLNVNSVSKICKAVNAIMSHDDFEQLSDNYCQYVKMQQYWLARFQSLRLKRQQHD